MIRLYESRLYPTAEQEAVLDSWLECCQQLYNSLLAERIKAWKESRKSITFATQDKVLAVRRAGDVVLREMPQRFLRDALKRVQLAYDRFFDRCKKKIKPAGFPRFRPINRYRSMCADQVGDCIVDENHIHVPKLGLVRCRDSRQHNPKLVARGKEPREIIGKVLTLRLVKRASGWYAQITVEDGLEPPKPVVLTDSSPVIGIDVGLETFATLSDGTPIENPRWLKKASRDLRRAHKAVSRKRKGSNNRRKAVKRLARKYERLRNRRRDFVHKESKKLVQTYDAIYVENLNIRAMARSRLSKSILDAAWGQFRRFIAYKAERAGKRFIAVDPCGTSQECSQCGAKVPKELSQRMHECPACGLRIHRDHNAALNILARGRWATACGGDVSPTPRKRTGNRWRNRKDSRK